MASYAASEQSYGQFDQHNNSNSNANGYASGGSDQSKSPLSSFGFLKGFGGEKKLKADGQPPKRRGPKPDSKPALTRRQELNRQAQRTHRERKEMYIKALEQEVMRLKEAWAQETRDKQALLDENRKLRDLLTQHGLPVPEFIRQEARTPARDPSSSGSFSGSYAPPSSASDRSPGLPGASLATQGQHQSAAFAGRPNAPQASGMDYDHIGIDFVLALERPCMDHMQMLCVKSQTTEGEISGHALMATCPPEQHLIERPDVQYPHQMPANMQAGDLIKLLDLSNRLPLDGEITPVMAWAAVLRHGNFQFLLPEDISAIRDDLLTKVRCYGFGAVLEEFEVDDAITTVLASKAENFAALKI